MKRLNSIIKTITIMALLFFSCSLPGTEDYGTLVVLLPGQAPRAAVSDAFTAALSYRIDCDGPGGRITRQSGAGASLSIPLNAGDWTVTVTVLNAAGQTIGSGTAGAVIESGKTTALQIPVNIDTGGNGITRFALTSPVSAEGVIVSDSDTIAVSVPFGTNLTNMNFTATHTGASINPAPGTPLDFTSPRTFTVRAENGDEKMYTVTVIPASGTAKAITAFSITGPVTASGAVNEVDKTVTVTVPYGTAVTAMTTSIVHTGASISPDTGTVEDFTNPVSYRVRAEDNSTQDYLVTVIHSPPPGGGTAVWPSLAAWQSYGFSSGLTQPSGTTLYAAAVSSGELSVYLQNADTADFDYLVNQFAVLGGTPQLQSESGFSNCELAYSYAGRDFSLQLMYAHASGVLMLSIEPDDPSGFAVWPDNSRWTAFNLSGLTQPAGTRVDEVTEMESMLYVTLNTIDNAAYEDLLSQITALLGTPYLSTGSSTTPEREDIFMSTMGANTFMVTLEIDTAYDEITIAAVKY